MTKSKIYTRQGDRGMTALFDGTRVSKDSPRIETNGAMDETNAWIGLARAYTQDTLLDNILEFVQHKIYACSAILANPKETDAVTPQIRKGDIDFLEDAIDHLELKTGPLSSFILPAGPPLAGTLHVARTVARRAERQLVKLSQIEHVNHLVHTFINRLSDLLFAAARYANHLSQAPEISWNPDPTKPHFPPPEE